MKKGDKKGSHVGIMLSFVIFVTFLVFLYSVVEPIIKTEQDKKSILDSLETNILEEVSSDLISVSIKIDSSVTESCVNLNNFFIETETTSKIIVKNELGESVDARKTGEVLQIARGGYYFFKVHNSENFNEIETTSLGSCGVGHTIGFIKNKTYAFETKINDLIIEYGEFGSEDYEDLKEELKVPSRNDFGFSFTDSEGTETIADDKEVTTNVYVEKIPVYYIDDDANVLLGFINIKVW